MSEFVIVPIDGLDSCAKKMNELASKGYDFVQMRDRFVLMQKKDSNVDTDATNVFSDNSNSDSSNNVSADDIVSREDIIDFWTKFSCLYNRESSLQYDTYLVCLKNYADGVVRQPDAYVPWYVMKSDLLKKSELAKITAVRSQLLYAHGKSI